MSGDGSLRVFGVLTDVTERRESEEALARLEDRRIGRRRLESLSRLAGDVAHDFDKLLAPVMGYAEMLAFELPEDDPKRADLTEIRDAARQAVDLTRQLLAFGRKLVLELHPTDVNEVVAGVERVLRRVRKEGIAIELRLADELWAVKADRVRLEHALMDLALDAQDAMPDGGVLTLETSNVTVTDVEDRRHEGPTAGPWVRIAVTDTGRGMTDEDVEKAFEPFHSTRERREGRGKGLGLASVYGIVKQHGGEIWASSEPARGTTFLIFLPRARDVAAGTVGEAGGSPPGEETVLVVEEDPSVRRLLCSALASWGFRALEAATAERAMDLASQHRGEIQLLVSDVVLPVSHGTELLRRLRERRPSLKALFITGYGDDMTAAQALRQAGAVLLPKPFSVHLLSHRVRTALHG